MNGYYKGCADQTIRMFSVAGKLVKNIGKTKDVVRALCKLPQGHGSKAHFASAGNDSLIQFWDISGRSMGTLHGHESFIYSLGCLPNGDIVSSSEDRTLRIWRGDACIQTLTHPAISVWCVAACPENGDIVSGASDRVIRVFSRSPDRQASEKQIKEFEDSVKASSIPQQQVGQVNKETLPGPEFLQQKSGTKEGQVQMIKEDNGSITAHQWSSAAQQWVSVGTVVDAVGSSGRKTSYQGSDYDYVFDVDIEDGKPPLKLPYNLSQNPYEVAKKFIEQNKLPVTYLDQVANFILSNTKGATIGNAASSQPDVSTPSSQSAFAMSSVKVLPQTQYLAITAADLQRIFKKVEELNKQLLEQGRKDLALNPSDESSLSSTVSQLEKDSSSTTTTNNTSSKANNVKALYEDTGTDVIMKIATQWPLAMRLPGLDLLRILAALSPTLVTYTSSSSASSGTASSSTTLIDHLLSSGVFDPDGPINNSMLAIRALANLFNTDTGRALMGAAFTQVHSLVQSLIARASATAGTNRNLTIALTTLYINYAVYLATDAAGGSKASIETASGGGGGDDAGAGALGKSKGNVGSDDKPLILLDDLITLIKAESVTDAEALYRALVAVGTLLTLGDAYREAARELMGLGAALEQASGKSQREKRIVGVVEEIRGML